MSFWWPDRFPRPRLRLEWGLQLERLFPPPRSLMVSGGLFEMSKSANFRKSLLCFDEGLEKSSGFFHTPSFACLCGHSRQTHLTNSSDNSVKLNNELYVRRTVGE